MMHGSNDAGGSSNWGKVLFISNLNWRTTDAEIEREASKYGAVKRVKFLEKGSDGSSVVSCIVEFHRDPCAVACMNQMNGHRINGKPCRVRMWRETDLPPRMAAQQPVAAIPRGAPDVMPTASPADQSLPLAENTNGVSAADSAVTAMPTTAAMPGMAPNVMPTAGPVAHSLLWPVSQQQRAANSYGVGGSGFWAPVAAMPMMVATFQQSVMVLPGASFCGPARRGVLVSSRPYMGYWGGQALQGGYGQWYTYSSGGNVSGRDDQGEDQDQE